MVFKSPISQPGPRYVSVERAVPIESSDLFPVVKRSMPNLLDNAIKKRPRIRAWRFLFRDVGRLRERPEQRLEIRPRIQMK